MEISGQLSVEINKGVIAPLAGWRGKAAIWDKVRARATGLRKNANSGAG